MKPQTTNEAGVVYRTSASIDTAMRMAAEDGQSLRDMLRREAWEGFSKYEPARWGMLVSATIDNDRVVTDIQLVGEEFIVTLYDTQHELMFRRSHLSWQRGIDAIERAALLREFELWSVTALEDVLKLFRPDLVVNGGDQPYLVISYNSDGICRILWAASAYEVNKLLEDTDEDPETGWLVPTCKDVSRVAIPVPRSNTYSLGSALHDLIKLLDVEFDSRGATYSPGSRSGRFGGEDVTSVLENARRALLTARYPLPARVRDD